MSGINVEIQRFAPQRRTEFFYEDVKYQIPKNWNLTEHNEKGIIEDFSKVLLRLESTNHCNFSCSFCPHPTMNRAKGFMNKDLIFKVLEDAANLGFKMLDLRNFGEPLLDRRLSQFAKHARDKGFEKIYIHTNGHPLTKDRLDEWGAAGITDVNLSLSPKTEFARTRKGIPVEKFFLNIEKLAMDKPQYFKILSVDYIRTGSCTEDEEKQFLKWLENLGIPKRIDISLHNWAVTNDESHYLCHRLWSSFTVLWNGDVALCCLDYEGDYILGNLEIEDIKSIVNSERYVKIRNSHFRGKFLAKCASCDMPKQKDV